MNLDKALELVNSILRTQAEAVDARSPEAAAAITNATQDIQGLIRMIYSDTADQLNARGISLD